MPLDLAGATLVFDLDGTLVDTAPDLIGALNTVLGEEKLAPVPLAAARHLVGQGGRALLRRGFADSGREVDPADEDRLFQRFLDAYREHIADESRPYPGVTEALEALSVAGARLAVCTNKPGAYARLLLDALGLAERFAAVVGADETPARKPDTRHLLHAIAGAGGDPTLALMVGDSLPDVAAARGAGAPVVLVSFGYTETPAAELGADAVIDRFDQLEATVERMLAPALSARGASAIGRPPPGSDA
ncbi:MAG: phosphoglycolate phosphatase [Caulobacteraceae bacterium]|nr:phosphoglycolate phosphatase [Caulobacter sp.]